MNTPLHEGVANAINDIGKLTHSLACTKRSLIYEFSGNMDGDILKMLAEINIMRDKWGLISLTTEDL